MILSSRIISIIFILLNEDGVLTGNSLAAELGVSVRTIKSEIMTFKPYLNEYGLEILSKKGVGYFINITDRNCFDEFFSQIAFKYSHAGEISNDFNERLNHIIHTLISADGTVHLDELAEELFVVKRSLSKEIKRARELLADYGLMVENRTNHGVYVKGSEFSKRLCQLDYYTYYYHKARPEFKAKRFSRLFDVPMDIRLRTRQIFLEEMRSSNTIIKDFYSQKIPVLLLLSYRRYIDGHIIDIPVRKAMYYKGFREYKVMERVIERTDVYFEKPLPENEKLFLTIMLLSAADLTPESDLKRFGFHFSEAVKYADAIMSWFSTRHKIAFFRSEDLRSALIRTLIPLSINMYFNIVEKNNWCALLRFEDVLTAPLSQHLAYVAAQVIHHVSGKFLCKEFIYQLAHVFRCAVDRKALDIKKKRLLIFSSSGYESKVLMAEELKLLFGQFIESVEIAEMYLKIHEVTPENYDLLLGLNPSYSNGVPSIMTTDLNREDGYKSVYKELTRDLQPPNEIPNLSPNCIYRNLSFKTKEDVFNFLAYKDKNDMQRSRELVIDFEQRENILSYDNGNGIAVIINFNVQSQVRKTEVVSLLKPFLWDNSEVEYVLYFELGAGITASELLELDKVLQKVMSPEGYLKKYLSSFY
ncbi:HTH domain-containing protein [Oscillospiraceae bacterium PP1C4]